jgi:hypothetical protein
MMAQTERGGLLAGKNARLCTLNFTALTDRGHEGVPEPSVSRIFSLLSYVFKS